MARFGKILVFLHVGLSFCFASWAVWLYTNRRDYKSKEGEVAKRKAEYDELAMYAVRPADGRWRVAQQELLVPEGWRPFERQWFARELEYLRTQATDAKPARRLARGPDGSIVFAPANPANPLAGDLFRMEAVKDAGDKEQKFASLMSYTRDLDSAVRQTEAE